MNWSAFLSSLVLSLIAAFGAAQFTAWFSLGRFYRERWWEKKFEAYTSIINALHDMAQSITHEIEEYVEPVLPDDELFNRTPSQERAEQIRKQYNEKHKIARDELRRRTDIGEFIISPQAVILLRALWKDLAERGEDYISDLEGGVKAVNDCLEQMRQLANDDLRGHTFPRWRAP